jgi:hypothetical protein
MAINAILVWTWLFHFETCKHLGTQQMSNALHKTYRWVMDGVDDSLKLEVMRRFVHNRSRMGVLVWNLLERESLRRWEANSRRGTPPAAAKYEIIRQYAERFRTSVLVETGTFLGDTVYALRNDFLRIVSIELDPRLAATARQRFADDGRITVLRGDSSRLLPAVLSNLDAPTLFWLDAHWSGGVTAHGAKETPVSEELEIILAHKVPGHVVLIDDSDLLGTRRDYPSLEVVQATVQRLQPGWVCENEFGLVRLHS